MGIIKEEQGKKFSHACLPQAGIELILKHELHEFLALCLSGCNPDRKSRSDFEYLT